MKTKLNILIMVGLCCLLLGGCASFIAPEIGAIANEDNRITYKAVEVAEGALINKDIQLTYNLAGGAEQTQFTGELRFDRSLTDSFPVIKRFFLKLSWLDEEGGVLQTVDITPAYSYLHYAPNKMKIDRKIPVAPGSISYCFNYYGVFQGEKPDVTEEWDIFLFPFTTP